jgi:protein gp37
MKISNAIGWCDETTNAVTGCDKVSDGCRFCYAATGTRARVLRAQGIETWGVKGVRHPVAQFAQKMRRLNKLCVCDKCHEASMFGAVGHKHTDASSSCGGTYRRIRLFADSNSDWLDHKWPIEVFANFLNEIRMAPNVDVLLLTKRPENWRDRIKGAHAELESKSTECRAWIEKWLSGFNPENLWLGVSVENQAVADLRIPQLLEIPAVVRFLSCEPLLSRVSLVGPFGGPQAFPLGRRIDWVIVGGESGKDRRDCGVEAITDIAAQCTTYGVPVYVKQDCSFKSGAQGRIPDEYWRLKQFPSVERNNGAARQQLPTPA